MLSILEDVITRTVYLLVIIFIVFFFYFLLPVLGAIYNRFKWQKFRKYYNELQLSPLLNYRQYRMLENSGTNFHFTGGIESLTEGKVLWVRGDDCTVPVSLDKSQCWLLPMNEGDDIPNPPEQIRWNRISTLTEGVKVFIGGQLKEENNRLNFSSGAKKLSLFSRKEKPLIVIFYNCPKEELTKELILAARTHNEYWNAVTPVSLVIGALSLIYIAASLLNRPAFFVTVITALVAAFVPVLPVIPPGLIFTAIFRRITAFARKQRAYRDLAKINNPELKSMSLSIKAYTLEVIAWLLLIAGVAFNVFFIFLIVSLLE